MRINRFYFPQKIGEEKQIKIDNAETVNQIQKVLRLGTGDIISLFDGSGFDFLCEILSLENRSSSLSVSVTKVVKSIFMPKHEIVLCASVVKKDNFEWIAEKATELGVTKIIPIISSRSEKKSLNEIRLNKIVVEASEQCGRGDVPQVLPVVSLSDIVFTEGYTNIAFHMTGKEYEGVKNDTTKSIRIFIGPEGGWTSDEIKLFEDNNISIYSLCKQTLRAETAVVAALTRVLL